jgi:hypothetical protein
VSVFTSNPFIAGSDFRSVAVAAWPWQRLHCSRSISAVDFSCFASHGWRRKTHLAFSGSFEGFHLRMASTTGQVAYKSKSGHSRHITYHSPYVRLRLWRDGVSSSFISLMRYFWFSLGSSVFVDRHLGGAIHFITWPLCLVYFCLLL